MTKLFSILFIFLVIFNLGVFSQTISSVKNEKLKIEKEINYLNKLISNANKDKTISVGKLKLLQQKIHNSERLLSNLSVELKVLNREINNNEVSIKNLNIKKENLLNIYSKIIYQNWKKRDDTNKLMFIFASNSFNQAYRRYKYLEQFENYSSNQIKEIEEINDSISAKNISLNKLILSKNKLITNINRQNSSLELEKNKANIYISSLQKKEGDLKRKLNIEISKRKKLDEELSKLIASQIKKSGSTSKGKFNLTPTEKLVSSNFVNNKGKLPWPVTEGFISKKFGLNIDPIYKRVSNFSNGIDITTSKNAEVRVVFNGVVMKIWHEPYWNYTVFVKHGNYLTVYSNLENVKVKEGESLVTKEVLGNVVDKPGDGSVLFFQLWKDNEKQNPAYWLAK